MDFYVAFVNIFIESARLVGFEILYAFLISQWPERNFFR